jgi:hypothetical protein
MNPQPNSLQPQHRRSSANLGNRHLDMDRRHPRLPILDDGGTNPRMGKSLVVDALHTKTMAMGNLRNVYAASELSITPKTQSSKIEALKEIIRAWGLNPEEVLTREAMCTPHRTIVDPQELENKQIKILCNALKAEMKKELRLT